MPTASRMTVPSAVPAAVTAIIAAMSGAHGRRLPPSHSRLARRGMTIAIDKPMQFA